MCKGNSFGQGHSTVWNSKARVSSSSMKIVLFADFYATSQGLAQAQYVLKQLCNEGHRISLFECSSLGSPAILYDEPQTETCEFCSQPLKTLEKKVSEADALLLVTDKPGFEIPLALQPVKHHLTGKSYVWRPYGINCTLIGGSVHSRQVAMRLHSLLEGSDFPYMAGVLPSTCSWTEKYAIDPSLETPGPCVL